MMHVYGIEQPTGGAAEPIYASRLATLVYTHTHTMGTAAVCVHALAREYILRFSYIFNIAFSVGFV